MGITLKITFKVMNEWAQIQLGFLDSVKKTDKS